MGRYLLQIFNTLWFIIKYAVLLGILAIILAIIFLSSASRDIRAAGASGLQGKQEISAAVDYVKSGQWPKAIESANQAQTSFASSLSDLQKVRLNPAAKNVPIIARQINDLEYLLKTGEILSRSLARIAPIAQSLEKIKSGGTSRNFIDLSITEKQSLLRLLYESEPELNGLKANLDLSLINLEKIHKIGILWPVYAQISDIKQELYQARDLLAKAIPVTKLLPALAGYPNTSRFLIILQNNDELRATGGFIGVYANLEINNGEVLSLKTDDSYHLDMPASLTDNWKKEPPAPIKKYLKVEKWYFRDSNWSPDWPSAAQQIQEIYNGELMATNQAAPELTGVMAINPELVSDLINLVGPITVRGETYTAENLQPLLQYNVEVAYKEQDISSWDRKEVVNELMEELKKRLFHLPSQEWTKLLEILDNNIAERNIQIFFNNPGWQNLAQRLEIDGGIKQSAGDYLMVVDSNFGAFKSDVVVKKNIAYATTATKQGLESRLTLNYRHEGDFDWRTTRYRSYTRVYTPLGSRLISLSGLDESTQDLSVVDDTQLDKTVFGFFLTVEPGASREIILQYQLPAEIYQISAAEDYRMLVQKQSGQRVESLRVDYKPNKGQSKSWFGDFLVDKYYSSI